MIWRDVGRIRAEAPLVHNITNYVVMNSTANALLALGASPVMAHALEEVEEMTGLARALVLNIGTLSAPWVVAMLQAGRAANKKGIPVILDPVGSGATRLRTATAQRLCDEAWPTIIRGNASEIASLAGAAAGPGQGTKGVDSTRASEETVELACELARRRHCVVVVSGPTDIVVGADAGAVIRIANGHPLMSRITGMGCAATALIGAFAAVNASPLQAAAHAMAVMGIAGEIAAEKAAGPGSMQVHFLDALYQVKEKEITKRVKLEKEYRLFFVRES